MPKDKQLKTDPINIHERRVAMPDGRYMVFFTFTDGSGRDLSNGLHGGSGEEPSALHGEAPEEQHV